MQGAMWLIGLMLASGGAVLIFASPPGMAVAGSAGAGLCGSGGLFLFVAYYLSQDRVHKLNIVRTGALAGSAAAAFSGFVTVMYYLGYSELPHARLFSALGYAGIAAGLAGAVYGYRYHVNADLLELAAALGLAPADSGLTRPDGRYDLKGVMNGVEVLLDGADHAGGKGRPHSVGLDIKCRVANSSGAWIAAYPEGFGNRPLGSLPAETGPVPYWDWYTVRSEPPDAAEKLISAARGRPDSVFQDKYGFKFLELKDKELFCRFQQEGFFREDWVRRLADQVSKLAASMT